MTTDIDALVAEGKKAALSAAHDDCLLLSDLADTLECTQAVVEAVREIKDREGKVCDNYDTCTHTSCQSSYAAWAIADNALAALGAPPEGDGRR